jgi:hypothetical protein
MPLILGAQSAVATGYSIDNCCRFDSASASKFERTISTDGDTLKFTFNVWIKRSILANDTMQLLMNKNSGGSRVANMGWLGSTHTERLLYYNFDGSGEDNKRTAGHFSDTGAWMNYHFIWDSANGDSALRSRVFINGSEVQAWNENDEPPLNDENMILAGTQCPKLSIGFHPYNNSNYYDGYMAQPILCDGQAYLPTKFGQFNEDTPTVWEPIDPAEESLSFGTHGFWLDFKDSADLGADVSGEGNDFTPSNIDAADQGTDTPTNNFCTMNFSDNFYVDATFAEGNNSVTIANGIKAWATGTMGVSTNKWYWEVKMSANTGSDTNDQSYGIVDRVAVSAADDVYGVGYPANYVYESQGRFMESETTNSNTCPDTYTTGDVMMVALDLDNDKLYFGKNGTWQCSGDPTSGATGTGAEDIKGTGDTDTSGFYFPACSSETTSRGATWQFNFGGSSAFVIASNTNSDGNGYGSFEYAVPAGYLSLCTKNLGSSGG